MESRLRALISLTGLETATQALYLLALGLGLLVGFSSPAGAATDRQELIRVATEHYDPEFLARGREYHRVRYVVAFVQIAIVLAAAVWVAAGPLGRWGAAALNLAGGRAWLGRILILTAVYGGFSLLRLPFSAFRFHHARLFGLRHDAWLGFLTDWAKAVGLGWILVVVVGLIVLGLFSVLPRTWWAAAWAAAAGLTVAYAAAAPVIIDPLFHRFTPLEDRELQGRLLDLARRGGIEAEEVLVADASRRTRAVNAYFAGVGKTRRIVLYDTLVQKFEPEEIELVLAHEVAHWRLHHLRRGLVLGLGAALLGFLIAHGVLGRFSSEGIGGLAGRADPALAVPAYALYIVLMILALVPSNYVSRRMEAQADHEALKLTGDPETFIRTETRLARENLSDVLPPAWIETVFFTHPSNARRILMGERAR